MTTFEQPKKFFIKWARQKMDIVALNVSLAMIIFVFRVEKVLWCAVIKNELKGPMAFLWLQAVVKLEQGCDCNIYSIFFVPKSELVNIQAVLCCSWSILSLISQPGS